jgi:uncharacterized protein (TIGR02145 family)
MNIKVRSFTILFAVIAFSACDRDEENVAPDTGVTIEGKKYPTVVVGTQIWTSANYAGPGGVGSDENNSKPEYGKYYSMAELASITLPEGWRIPSQEDYTKLAQFYGITPPSHGPDTEKIRSLISESNWNNVSGTNAFGFNAYPAGYVYGTSLPTYGDIAEFWASEGKTLSIQEAGATLTSLRLVFYQSDNSPNYKFNVRFVKD